ncbi:MAG: outer membrane lipoprotein-sorting protein [Candidatus Aminicenantes bacterium]|nr:outer membrane lipoprotein-sorting protein [Candidatus Aminicenantes bacterium]
MSLHRNARRAALFVLALSILAARVPLRSQEDARDIVKKIDALYRAETSRALVEMAIVTPHWERTLKMRVWSMGMDKTFIRILEPKKESGMATLRVGNEMWNYLPRSNRVMRVPPSMMMGSWMGSDFTNDDLVKEYTFFDSYTFEMARSEDEAPEELTISCVPREGLPIVWGRVVISVRASDHMPLREKAYDERGRLAREIHFREVRTFGGRRIPSVMELAPKTKEGHKTVLRYLEAEFNIPLDKSVFTLQNLRRRSRP